jgi:membrane-associated phospholipid phosphatase
MRPFSLLLLLFLLPFQSIAQQINPINSNYLKSYYTDCRNLILSPVNWETDHWVTFTVTGLSIIGLSSFDGPINSNRSILKKWDTSFLSQTQNWGNGLYSLPALGLLYGYGWLNRMPKYQYAALDATKAFILSRALVQVPKFLFQRVRPSDFDSNPFLFLGPLDNGANRSFPSGHTTSIFASVSVLNYYFDGRSFKIISYSLAGLVGLQRIASGEHWFTDVVVGAAFGMYCGRFLVTNKPIQKNLTFYPYFGQSGLGILVRL